MKIYKSPHVEIKTIKRLKGDTGYLLDYLGDSIKLNEITMAKYQMFMDDLSSTHAHSTCIHVNTSLRSMFAKAVNENLMRINPSTTDTYVGGTDIHIGKNKQSVLDLKQFKALMDDIMASEDCVAKYVVFVHASTGMRFGEVLGLSKDKFNLFNNTLLVSKMYDYAGTHEMKKLKGGAHSRKLHLPDSFFKIMNQYFIWREKQILNGNIKVNTETPQLIFTGLNGKPISNTGVNNYIKSHCEKCGFERITSHGFRRTQATLMNLAGNNLTYIADFLGHADSSTTVRYYIKATDTLREINDEKKAEFYERTGLSNIL